MEMEDNKKNSIQYSITISDGETYTFQINPKKEKNKIGISYKKTKFTFLKSSARLLSCIEAIFDQIFRDFFIKLDKEIIDDIVRVSIVHNDIEIFQDERIISTSISKVYFTYSSSLPHDSEYCMLRGFLNKYIMLCLNIDFDI